jgi:hypothetical protein
MEQWQWPQNNVGGRTEKRTAPQKHDPGTFESDIP